MKKLTSALLALILCLSLAACGAGPDAALPSAAVETAEAETPAATMPPVTAASPSPAPEPVPSATPTATAAPSASAAHTSEPEPAPEPTPVRTTAPAASTPSAQPSSGTGGTQGGGVNVPSPESGGNLVWIPTNGGTRYHSHSGCSGMIDPIQVSVETAIANGFTPCGRCW